MNSEEEIFAAAAALPAEERAAYLDKACAGEPDLRARVEGLLRSHDATGFMEDHTAVVGGQPLAEQSGERIGRYRLLQQIGEGGFGVVWMAEQVEPVTRRVALKIIKAGMDTREVIARFEAERQALAMMDHPNIAKVFDAGATDKGRPFFVMELVKGIPITKFCDERGFTTRQRLELFADVCSAINHAHQKGVIHRDIKPSNVMVTLNGDRPVVKVIDFGIAKATQGRLTDKTLFTRFEQFIGTPAYMSPEQAGLAETDIDTRADIYSLGVLLYELLTGKPPFNARSLLSAGYEEMLRIIREVEPPKPSARLKQITSGAMPAAGKPNADPPILNHKSSIAPDLDWIVMKAIEKDRTRRYETANGLALDIQRHLAHQPVLARPPGVCYVLSKFVWRHKFGFAASIAIALSLLGGIAGTIRALLGERVARNFAETQKDLAEIETNRAKAQVREASRSDTATAQQRLAEGKWQEAVAYLGRAIRYDPENTNAQDALWFALRYGERDAGRLPVLLLKQGSSVSNAILSPDGTRVLIPSGTTARLCDTTTGQLIGAPLPFDGAVGFARFSSDGTRVATARSKSVRIWDANTGQPIGAQLNSDDYVWSVSLSPNGIRLVTTYRSYTTQAWDTVTGQSVGPKFNHAGKVGSVSFSPDGTRFITATSDGTVCIWDAKTGKPLGVPLKHIGTVRSAGFSPDGTRVITASEDLAQLVWTARIWDAATGQPIGEPLKHEERVSSADFSPSGTRIVTASDDKTARIWDATTGQPIGEPLKHEWGVRSARFSPDGTLVATASDDGTARVWDATTGQPIGAPLNHEGSVKRAVFSSDGTRVVTASDDRTARMWDATTGQPLSEPFEHEGPITDAMFNPDGTRVVTTGAGGTLRVWDAIGGQTIGAPLENEEPLTSAWLNPDGTRVVRAGDDETARVWDASNGQPIGTPLKHEGRVRSADFSPDGTRVVTASDDKTARMWDATTGQPIGAPLMHVGGVGSALFSPDGTRVVTASDDKTARIWDATTGQSIGGPLKHEWGVRSARFSTDSTRVVTASGDQTARVWDSTTGQPIGPPLKHQGPVTSACFNPNGTGLVTVSQDRTVRARDSTTGQPIGPHLKNEREVIRALSSPIGISVVTAVKDRVSFFDNRREQRINASIAESLTAFIGGARLDPVLGSLQSVSPQERLALWQTLEPALAALPDWVFVAKQAIPRDPRTALVSLHMTMTIRQAATSLIGTLSPAAIRKAANVDPGHPLIPFAFARIEVDKTEISPINPVRAVWLIDYGIERLPADTSAVEFRLAAELVSEVAKTLPKQGTVVLALLDRAAKLSPENQETKMLRKLNQARKQ